MKKRLVCMLLMCVMLLPTALFVSCSDATPEPGTVTRMTVDINPSVEFIVDEQNKVVSVTALNDDGSILIVGETFVGKTPEEAVALMVTLASETGYLVKGNATAEENTVKISVSGDSKYAEQLMKDVSKKAEGLLEELDIKGKVEKAEAMKLEELRKLALATSLYTEEEIAAMEEKQLYQVIALGRVETAQLLTEEMRNAYFAAKEYKISFAQSEQTAKVIEGMGALYSILHTSYKAALDVYSKAITELDTLRYETLVSPESEYQKSLTALREAKVELLKQKNYTASLEVNGEEYASATVTLQLSEENYEKALAAYEQLGTQANAAISSLITALQQAKEKLHQLEDTLFDENIKEKLQQKASEIEASLNTAKDAFFTEFETAHADDMKAIEDALLAKKQQLRDGIEAGKS